MRRLHQNPTRRSESPMLRKQRDHVLPRQRIDDATLTADDALGAPQRIDDGLLGRIDGRAEERVELVIGEGDRRRRPSRRPGRSRRCRDGRPSPCASSRGRHAARRARAARGAAARRWRRRRFSCRPVAGGRRASHRAAARRARRRCAGRAARRSRQARARHGHIAGAAAGRPDRPCTTSRSSCASRAGPWSDSC
jgi:hypothetical protein